MKVKAKKLTPTAILPTYGSESAACADLYADLETADGTKNKVEILPHHTVKVGTGWSFQPPTGYFGAIFARSGLATKQGLRPANCVGIADEDYTGEYIVAVHNDSDEPKYVEHGDRIAQLIFMPYEQTNFEEVEELDKTTRGAGGFGSSGK